MSDEMIMGFDAIAVGTDIKDVKVDPRLRVRCDTGLTWLNLVCSGPDAPAGQRGFVPSEVILFTGGPGCGKSTMGLSIADSMTSKGHTVLFVGGEESKEQTAMTFERLGLKHGFTICNPVFIEKPDGLSKEESKEVGKNTLDNHLAALMKRYVAAAPKLAKGEQRQTCPVVVIDSLQTLNCGKWGFNTNSKTPKRVLRWLCKWAKENFAIVIVIGQVGKNGDFKGDNALRHMVDGHLELALDDDDKSPTCGCRLLTFSKHRFGPAGITAVLDLGKRGFVEHGRTYHT